VSEPDLLRLLKDETFGSIRLLLDGVAGLSDEQVQSRPGGTLPSIAFHVWHSARWADYDSEACGGVPQIWLKQGFAERWQLQGIETSDGGTGTGLGDDEAAALQLPGTRELLLYASAAFMLLEQTVERLVDGELTLRLDQRESRVDSIEALLLAHLTHVNRHLGMVEAIKGLQGLSGTATR
jgi:DinB superfamily